MYTAAWNSGSPDAVASFRIAGDPGVYLWTFTGTDAGTGNPLRDVGWEEWDLDDDLKVRSSRGSNDAADYALQAAGA